MAGSVGQDFEMQHTIVNKEVRTT